jgi:hypothetical protein
MGLKIYGAMHSQLPIKALNQDTTLYIFLNQR